MVRYEIKFPHDPHWDALWDEIEKNGKVKHPYDIDSFLSKYRGRIYLDEHFRALRAIKGIEFKTGEDLVFFKLRFN